MGGNSFGASIADPDPGRPITAARRTPCVTMGFRTAMTSLPSRTSRPEHTKEIFGPIDVRFGWDHSILLSGGANHALTIAHTSTPRDMATPQNLGPPVVHLASKDTGMRAARSGWSKINCLRIARSTLPILGDRAARTTWRSLFGRTGASLHRLDLTSKALCFPSISRRVGNSRFAAPQALHRERHAFGKPAIPAPLEPCTAALFALTLPCTEGRHEPSVCFAWG
jgi:hypothetical protein